VKQLGTTSVACLNGLCASNDRCPIGYGHCSSDPTQICETHLDTTQQCGACNHACAHDYEQCTNPLGEGGSLSCVDGCTFYYTGPAKTIRCGEACVSLDINNCGACGVVCTQPDHGVSMCTAPPIPAPSDYHCDAVCEDGYFLSPASCVLPSRTWSGQALPGSGTFYGIWGSSASDVYAVGATANYGGGIIYHSAGNGSWVAQTVLTSMESSFRGVWGSSASDVYAVGLAGIYHSSGDGNWTLESGSAGLYGVWGSGANDVYVVGGYGIILHSTGGGQWDSEPLAMTYPVDLYSVWGSGPNDVYVGGWERPNSPPTSVLAHSTGNGNWGQLTTNTTGPINGIWGSGPNDVYAVGAGPILHSTGNGVFVAQTQLFQHSLLGVWGSGASDVYAVGAESSVLHSAGDGAWAPDDPSIPGSVHAVWGSGSGDVYVVGTNNDQSGIPVISHLP
jgi:hypothetical protein